MKFRISGLASLVAVFAFPVASPAFADDTADPPALYLMWQQDPTTTMTIHWHTITNAGRSEIHFRAANGTNWRTVTGHSQALPDSDRHVHTVEITRLQPETDYWFRIGAGTNQWKFRTMPRDLSKPVRFITGGDVYQEKEWMDNMNQRAANLDPAFVLIGGDIAYADERPDRIGRYFDYFDSWKRLMVAPDGRLIPMLVTIGNHEVRGGFNQTAEAAPYFYTFFSMPGLQGYNHLDFGNYLTLLLLDTQHTQPVAGAQTEWVRNTLAQRTRVPHVFPIYHVPAYSSYRPFEGKDPSSLASMAVREHWCPLFEKYGVRVVFENHDHTFKRTHPLRAGKVDPKGVVYLGDGAWAVRLRIPRPMEGRPYLAKAESVRHFFVVTLFSDQRHIVALDEQGRLIDEVYQRVK